ncbi:hypothetical protein LTS18_008559, partial [Coniosporium uncinatum]
IKRTYSPPIPTAITSDYFQAPKSAGLSRPSFGDDEDEGGMVTGVGRGSNDTVGPALHTKRKRRKELLEEDDSSDLSDESDDDADATQRATQQIKFSKMPLRTRAGSSPLRGSNAAGGPSVLVMSPTPNTAGDKTRTRSGSLGGVEAVKQRARRDTTTSSEISSENELDPAIFKRKQVNPQKAARASHLLAERIQEDEREATVYEEQNGVESDDSSLDSDFAGSAESGSILGAVTGDLSSPLQTRLTELRPTSARPSGESPRRSRQAPAVLEKLPPARPISMIQPVSLLAQALRAKNKRPGNPIERFASLSGKGDPNPFYIKIHAPFSEQSRPFELLLRKSAHEGAPVKVADAIGLALWQYGEQDLKPPVQDEKKNVNRWILRMVDDEEVDYDFPALNRTQPISQYTSNNNRGVRPRSREKPWDEFALVEASESEFTSNEAASPEYGNEEFEPVNDPSKTEAAIPKSSQTATPAPSQVQTPMLAPLRNPIMGPSFAGSIVRKDSSNLLDAPAAPSSHATPRTGAPKTLNIRFIFDEDGFPVARTKTMEVTTDTYLAEVFEEACRKFGANKELYVLKLHGKPNVVFLDRTIESLGPLADLDLAKKRFPTEGWIGIAGSPGSSSPNAPLLIPTGGGTPKKSKRGALGGLTQTAREKTGNPDAYLPAQLSLQKRWNVVRKQPMSFSSSSARILSMDAEYMYIMPLEGGSGKITSIHFESIVGSKVSRRHPKTFRVTVWKEREQKRYDFDAQSVGDAQEIVREIRSGMERFQPALAGV